jgi:hypothetical protein
MERLAQQDVCAGHFRPCLMPSCWSAVAPHTADRRTYRECMTADRCSPEASIAAESTSRTSTSRLVGWVAQQPDRAASERLGSAIYCPAGHHRQDRLDPARDRRGVANSRPNRSPGLRAPLSVLNLPRSRCPNSAARFWCGPGGYSGGSEGDVGCVESPSQRNWCCRVAPEDFERCDHA